ncbi:MAG: DoxX family protein [Bacteroidota bacterium]|nr:DoxX family protein [Bacteroidota bacterium]
MKRTAILFSGISHFIYGILTFSLPFYKAEFIRYGFDHFRELIGGVQIVFGICLLIGLYSYKSRVFSSLVLALLMGGALGTRIYIGDGPLETAPSLFYLIINLFIFSDFKNFKR